MPAKGSTTAGAAVVFPAPAATAACWEGANAPGPGPPKESPETVSWEGEAERGVGLRLRLDDDDLSGHAKLDLSETKEKVQTNTWLLVARGKQLS